VVLVDDRLRPVLADAAHGWQRVREGLWRFELDGLPSHEALAWPGDVASSLAELRERKPTRIILLAAASARAPGLREDTIALATRVERVEMHEGRLEILDKQGLPAAAGLAKGESRLSEVRLVTLPEDVSEAAKSIGGSAWVALGPEYGGLVGNFADELIALIPLEQAIEDGWVIELLAKLLAEPELTTPEPKPPAPEPKPPAPEPPPSASAKPVAPPPASEPPKSSGRSAVPWVAGVGMVAAASVAIVFLVWPSNDPCVARKLSIGADNSIGIEETPDPECRGSAPLEVRVTDAEGEPLVARVWIGKEVIASNDAGFASFEFGESIPNANLPIAVEVAGRKRKVISQVLEPGGSDHASSLTIQVADECRFAFVDAGGQRLTDIESPALRWGDVRATLTSLDDGKGTWELARCPSATDTLVFSGTRKARACSRTIAASELLDHGTLAWCEPCTLVLTEGGEAVAGIERVSVHFGEGPPIEAISSETGTWRFECENQGFSGRFEPTKVTYARRGQVEVELTSCGSDRWRRVCPLDAPVIEPDDGDTTDTGGEIPPPPSVPSCSEDTVERVLGMVETKQLTCEGHVTLRIANSELSEPSAWASSITGRFDQQRCSKRVKCP
jgi:hypothetical protein